MNKNIISQYLRKKNKSRFNDVDTILFVGGNSTIEESCKNNEIVGMKSIKSSEETGDETNGRFAEPLRGIANHRFSGDSSLWELSLENEFVHVILSVLHLFSFQTPKYEYD